MIYSDFDLQCEIATNFMNNKVGTATKYCYNIIHNNKGQVADEFYIMLFDMLKVQNQKKLFDEAAEQYHKITGRLPPDWENKDNNKMVSEFNTLEIKGSINASVIDTLNKFYQSCVNNNFGRLDFNQFKIKDSDSQGLQMLLNTLYKLKRLKNTEIILMGDNTILNFDPQEFYIEPQKYQPVQNNNQIHHNASLELLKKEREAKNAYAEKLYADNEAKRLKKITELNAKKNDLMAKSQGGGNGSLGVMSTARKPMDKQLAKEIQAIEEELALINAQEIPEPEKIEESYVERRFEKNYQDENDKETAQLTEEEILQKQVAEITKKEELLFLLKLEILQWNGEAQKYLSLSEQYRAKYKKFSPDYQIELESKNRIKHQNRVGSFEIMTAAENNFNSVSQNTPVIQSLANEINTHNLDAIIKYLDDLDHNTHPVVFMNLNKTNFFTYHAAKTLMLFMQQQRESEKQYDLFIKNANSLIKVIFKMSGLSEYVKY